MTRNSHFEFAFFFPFLLPILLRAFSFLIQTSRQGEADAPSETFRRKGFKEKLSDWSLHTSLEHISELIFLPFVLYATTLYHNVQPIFADIAGISYKMLSPVPSYVFKEIFQRFPFCPKFYMSLSNTHVTK